MKPVKPDQVERNCEKMSMVNDTNLRSLAESERSVEMAGVEAGGSCGVEFLFCLGWLTL